MEEMTGRLITDEEQKQWDADSKKRALEFDAECRILGYNPRTKFFGFMFNKGLSEIEYKEKLTTRYNTWVHNLRNMPVDVKKQKINEAQKELEQNYNNMAAKVNYLYKQEKLDFLATFKDKIKDAIHIGKLETMPTWAKENELNQIWSEVLKLKWVDDKEKSNFFKAFGVFKDTEPFVKIKVGDSATKLMVFLTLMVDRNDILLSDINKTIANNLFRIELKNKINLKPDEFKRWSEKLPITNKLRKPIVIIPQDAGSLTF